MNRVIWAVKGFGYQFFHMRVKPARIATVLVRHGKVFVPVMAVLPNGMYLYIFPVYTAAISVEGLTDALKKAMRPGHPKIPMPRGWPRRRPPARDPMLKAANVKSWVQLARDSRLYSVRWLKTGTVLSALKLDEEGRADFSKAERSAFPKDAALGPLVEAILKDIEAHPELKTNE